MKCLNEQINNSYDWVIQTLKGDSEKKLRREIWPLGRRITLMVPEPGSMLDSFNTQPYLVVLDEHGRVYPWFPTNDDQFAEDWKFWSKISTDIKTEHQ